MMLILTAASCASFSDVPANAISFGPAERQWLLVFEAPSPTSPTPVYVWAHPNGSNASDIPAQIITDMHAIGVSVISWESILLASTPDNVETGWADAEVMLNWIKANAADFNIDPDQIIIGGASRGSGLSWKIANSGDPAILGVYMSNALPDGFWEFDWDPTTDVNSASPVAYFAYRPTPGDGDGHRPENGEAIGAAYADLGIGDRFTLVHSLSEAGIDSWDALPGFVQSVMP